ncbi:putative SNF1-related protein kinase regulatory subunit gamma 1 [Hibiscus syriacus]|uniref:SNF1-related protein kinase regulatory subunit gamma 1 n=1 Tax=Hibiscus syriacus TaxID=106335 RepID=A0A6A2ZGF2_HIBSY|nr:putative SNF1-related protein kinase regulatory subunit gamma 1 [Hibiscus syriacus]
MESCCLKMKANSHLVNVRKGGFINGDNAFLGDRIRGSLNNSLWVNHVANSLSVDNKKEMKLKTGVSAILTSNNRREATDAGSTSNEQLYQQWDKQDLCSDTVQLGSPQPAPCAHVLAATQTSGEAGNKWFQGTADAVRQFIRVFESHVDKNADITISYLTMGNSRSSDYGLVKIDGRGRIIQFSEKPKGADLKAMQTDTTLLGLSPQEALKSPYIASMGVYVFKTEVLLKLLRWRFPASNDFGSEIIPAAVEEHDVHVPKFEFYDPKTPFYTSRHLPPTKIEKCRIKDALISHGCFLRECTVQHSVIGEPSRLDSGVELQDTVMLGADYYQTETEIAPVLADGKVPIGIGHNTKIRNCNVDKNAKTGNDVIIANKDGVEEADRPDEGFYIRS